MDIYHKASERFYLNVITAYEQKLKQYMSEEEHNEFIKNTAKQCFLAEMLACPNKDFKDAVFEKWDEIMGEIK